MTPSSSNPAVTRTAWLLGLAGLIPFVMPAALALAGNTAWLAAQQHYAACILAFLGALHWGPALNGSAQRPAILLAWGVVPSLMAWWALQWAGTDAALVLAAALVLTFAADVALARFHAWPVTYLPLRTVLTCVACVSLLLAWRV
jgi:predicted neutral ceramidase superfamily lipid hydrolase